ncbi:MAG: alpha/beta hydrolase [Bacillota bacterium]
MLEDEYGIKFQNRFTFDDRNGWSGKYQRAMEDGEQVRFDLALSLADEEYRHPECERANTRKEQRSFFFHHQKVTDITVLVIHGWTACPFEMRELGENLFKRGYNVYGVRLAGHGTSVEDYAKYGHADWEASAGKGLAIASLAGRRVVIIGESMGGALAAILAAAFPRLTAKIILCAPCFQVADWRAELTVFGLVRLFIPEVDFGELRDWQQGYWYNRIPTTGVAELIKVAHKARKTGPLITAPALIIQATNDKMVNPKGAARFFASLHRFSDAQKQLILFEKGHHNLTVDLNPQKKQVFEWIIANITGPG